MAYFQYPVKVEDNKEGRFLLHFRDIPQINSEIWDLNDLDKNATDAIATALEVFIEKKLPFSKASNPEEGGSQISLPEDLVSKITVHNASLGQ